MISFERPTRKQLQIFSSLLDKKHRQESGLFHIEGVRLFDEFLRSGFEAEWIAVHSDFVTAHPQLANTIRNKFENITFQVNGAELKKISDTEHSQGIVAGLRKIKNEKVGFTSEKKDLILALDGISDPGNMGTIIRSADWFGIDKLILSKNCADIYNPKVIRASMGSIFRVTCMVHDLEEFLSSAKKNHYATYAASVDEHAVNLDGKIKGPSVLVVGSEARGISENVKNICEFKIKIPGYGKAESLNAAVVCGILIYEFSRQLNWTKL